MTAKTPTESRYIVSQRLQADVNKILREKKARELKIGVIKEPTLRDEFAMAALPGIIRDGANPNKDALEAYKYANAMLAVRKQLFEEEVVAPALAQVRTNPATGLKHDDDHDIANMLVRQRNDSIAAQAFDDMDPDDPDCPYMDDEGYP